MDIINQVNLGLLEEIAKERKKDISMFHFYVPIISETNHSEVTTIPTLSQSVARVFI